MSGRKPHANGTDLAAIMAERKARARFQELNDEWIELCQSPDTVAAAVDPVAVLLTARFEVIVGLVADAMGLPADEVMVQVESAALARAATGVRALVEEYGA